MIEYRTFRNIDPPGLALVWNESLRGRGAVPLPNPSALEHVAFAKPIFDPAGLYVALEGGTTVGFVHAGFGPDAKEAALSTEDGVTCLVAVRPAWQRRGIGSELLRRAEAYLRERGARTLHAGSMAPLAPFYFGLYGGSSLPGWLESDAAAAPFITRHGYTPARTMHILHRRIDGPLNLADGRFPGLRKRYEMKVGPHRGIASWWQECVAGPIELSEFRLEDKATGEPVARAVVWELDGFSRRWGETAVGLVTVEVVAALRRQGLARFLLAQMLRYLQDQYFNLVEVQVPADDQIALDLFSGVGFAPADTGHSYRRTAAP